MQRSIKISIILLYAIVLKATHTEEHLFVKASTTTNILYSVIYMPFF